MSDLGPPNIDLYSRNGFAGPMATLVRGQYAPTFTRAVGSYTPRRLSLSDVVAEEFADPRSLPKPVLTSGRTSIEIWRRAEETSFALRNVLADELHYVNSGSARFETDFGVLDVVPGDFVLVPRAVTYRVREISGEFVDSIVVTPSQLELRPENAPGVLNMDLHVDTPRPELAAIPVDGEYEIVLRHGSETTSYFFDYDPLPTMQVLGSPIVRRFNIANVHGVGVESGGLMPPKIIDDAAAQTMMFYVGNRRSDRPPVHHNADFDELIFYVRGPGAYGAVEETGTLTWTPKGIIHQGPEEEVPEGFDAFLIETREQMALTPLGERLARLMETSQFGVHKSAASTTADP